MACSLINFVLFFPKPPLELKHGERDAGPAATVHDQERRGSSGRPFENNRRGATKVGQRGVGSPVEAGRGGEDERHLGPRESDARGEPAATTASK